MKTSLGHGCSYTGTMTKEQQSIFLNIPIEDLENIDTGNCDKRHNRGKKCSSCKEPIEKGESFIMWALDKFMHLRCNQAPLVWEIPRDQIVKVEHCK